MKLHKFERDFPAELKFGCPLYRCMSCSSISLDLEMLPYSDTDNWIVLSEDCEKSGKLIELLIKDKNSSRE